MKHAILPSLLRRAAALLCAVSMVVPTAHAASKKSGVLQTETDLVSGLTYFNTVDSTSAGRVESFHLEFKPGKDTQAIFLPSDGTVYGASTADTVVQYAQDQGYHVLAAMNTDFFSTGGVPMGLVIQNGEYQSGAENESAILIDDKGKFQLCEEPVVEMMLTNATTGNQVVPHHFNKLRVGSGGLYLLNDDFSSVSTRAGGNGWYVLMQPVDEEEAEKSLTVDCRLDLKVVETFQYGSAIAIPENTYILTADDRSGYGHIFESFHVGDRIVLTTSCEDKTLRKAQWASGCGDILVDNKKITDSDDWDFAKDGRNPRTALGVKKDGTAILYTVDGRQSKHSVGMSEEEIAKYMKNAGCTWAVNLDGGGSTVLSVWLPGQSGPAVQNKPSDGSPRKCGEYLLIVTEAEKNPKAKRAAMTENGLVVLTESSLTLPDVVTVAEDLTIMDTDPDNVKITASRGTVKDGVYTAKKKAGTDTLKIKAGKVSGTATIHVVDELTELTVKADGKATDSITLLPGKSVKLTATGSYYGRTALRDISSMEVDIKGDIGTMDENFIFTAGEEEGSGTIVLEAGDIKKKITVTVEKPRTVVPIANDHWAFGAVSYCNAKDMLSGMNVEGFDWDSTITRAQFILSLYNVLGQPAYSAPCTFTDVAPTDYYYNALSWGQELGIAGGVGDGTFNPGGILTREQAFTILRRALPQLNITCQDAASSILPQYNYADVIADYAKPHIATLTIQGLVTGSNGGVNPQGQLTWAQTAALLFRLSTLTPVTADTETAETTALCLAEGNLNVRLAPASDASIISVIPGGSEVCVTEQLEGWYQVFFSNEENQLVLGYASADYLEIL